MKWTKAGGRIVKSCSPFSAAKWQRQKSRQSRGKSADFLRSKKYYSALTVWIVGTEIERGLSAARNYAILEQKGWMGVRCIMRSKILYTAGSIVALLVVLTIFFSIRPEGFLRRGEAAVTQAEVEAAGAAVSFTGKKAGANIPRVTGVEDFMAQYPFEQFTVEPVNAVPTGVYELARWRSSTAVVGHRTRNYSQATTSALWAMTGYNEYYIIEFPDGTHALALFDRGLAADLAKGKAVTLPISARAGVNTYAKPYLQDICAEYGADLENVVYALTMAGTRNTADGFC